MPETLWLVSGIFSDRYLGSSAIKVYESESVK